MISLARDITDRKRAEAALRREQQLLRDMLDLHERDRKLVAYEIHDGLAQQLTGAALQVPNLRGSAQRSPMPRRKRSRKRCGCCARP